MLEIQSVEDFKMQALGGMMAAWELLERAMVPYQFPNLITPNFSHFHSYAHPPCLRPHDAGTLNIIRQGGSCNQSNLSTSELVLPLHVPTPANSDGTMAGSLQELLCCRHTAQSLHLKVLY